MDIIWKGNEHTNSSSREGYVPFIIVNHISVGSMSSMDAWFTDPSNDVSSAHFGVSKEGKIHQYVKIERMAWDQGIPKQRIHVSKAQVVRDMGVNPNLYAVSIEHEGMRGNLTEAQFRASVKLHHYIRDYVADHYNTFFSLDRYHVIGHSDVNPVGKPYCPGPQFPWDRLYDTLREGDEAKMEELRKQIADLESQNASLSDRISKLEQNMRMQAIPSWAQDAIDAAVDKNLVLNPENSSYDFYRLLVVLHRKGVI